MQSAMSLPERQLPLRREHDSFALAVNPVAGHRAAVIASEVRKWHAAKRTWLRWMTIGGSVAVLVWLADLIQPTVEEATRTVQVRIELYARGAVDGLGARLARLERAPRAGGNRGRGTYGLCGRSSPL